MNQRDEAVGRIWSWAESREYAQARQHEANGLIGQRVTEVAYFTLDYRRAELFPHLIDRGPRRIDSDEEWTRPTWLYHGFDSVDFGVELHTEGGGTYSLTWDPPGMREGIGLQPVPMLGTAVAGEADLAIWSVSGRVLSWQRMAGAEIQAVDLHYLTWDERAGELWCPRIALRGDFGTIEFIMGDERDGMLVPSADNVAILHPGTTVPNWEHLHT